MQVIEQEFLTQAILEATSSVFVTMLDSTVEPGLLGADQDGLEGGLVSLVGLTGPWSGTGSICCGPAAAARIAARMLMMEPPAGDAAVTDEIMDAVAEIANMIFGSVKNSLEERLGPMAIAIPTVVYGRNLHFKSLTGMPGISIPFTWGSDRMDVRLCLSPTAGKQSYPRAKADPFVLQRV